MADTGVSAVDIPVLVLRCAWAFIYTVYLSALRIWHTVYPPPGKSLRGKHVLVTGAGGALGRELALCFAKEGCRVTCVDVNLPECEETARLVSQLFGSEQARSFLLDVTDKQAVLNFSQSLQTQVGPLDILVNNAGIVQAGALLDVTEAQISKIIDVNLMSHFWTVRAFLPQMLAKDSGHIVAISSAAALAVASNIAPYTASKAGVSALMGCLREELRNKRSAVKTTTVQPFFLAPPQNKKHWEVKSVLSDITASSVAVSTLQAVKQDLVTVTLPNYLFFVMYLVRLIPAKASDLWRDAFSANIDSLSSTKAAS